MQPSPLPLFIIHFLFKEQDDTAHKGIYSLPLNLQCSILIVGFLPAFFQRFLIQARDFPRWGNLKCCLVAGGRERPGHLQAVASVQTIVSCT